MGTGGSSGGRHCMVKGLQAGGPHGGRACEGSSRGPRGDAPQAGARKRKARLVQVDGSGTLVCQPWAVSQV